MLYHFLNQVNFFLRLPTAPIDPGQVQFVPAVHNYECQDFRSLLNICETLGSHQLVSMISSG